MERTTRPGVPLLALSVQEECEALGISWSFFVSLGRPTRFPFLLGIWRATLVFGEGFDILPIEGIYLSTCACDTAYPRSCARRSAAARASSMSS